MTPTANRLATVNGLRGLAILAVMYFHQSDWRLDGPFIPGTGISLGPLLHNTWTGVNLFFVLSGFVLFLPYVNGRRTLATLADALTFWRRRFFRLMPAYYAAAIVLIAVTYLVWHPAWLGPDAARILTLGFVVDRYHFTPEADGSFWSLGVEVLFSLVFPLLLVLAGRIGLWRLLGLVLLFCLAARIAGRVWNPYNVNTPNPISDNIFGRLDEFFLGMALAQLHVTDRIGPRARFLLAPALLLVAAALVGFEQCRTHHWAAVWMAPLNNVLDAGLCGVLAASLSGRGWAVRMLGAGWLQVTGMMCYSLYLWHQPLADWVEAGAPDLARPQRVALWVVLSFAVAALSYRFIEFGKTRDWRALFLLRPPVVAAALPGAVLPP